MSIAEQVSRLARRWLERWHQRRAAAMLAAMDPRLLADIGYPVTSDMQPQQRRNHDPGSEPARVARSTVPATPHRRAEAQGLIASGH